MARILPPLAPVLLITCGLLQAAPTTQPAGGVSGLFSITVQNGVPFAPGATGQPNQDLLVDLACAEGRFEPRGWAFVPAVPGVEHEVEVTKADIDGDRVHLELLVNFRHQLPTHLGGSGRYTLDLEINGQEFEGTYSGQTAALDEKSRGELWDSLGGKGTAPALPGLRSGKVQSLTHLARGGVALGVRDDEPIAARGRIEPLPATLPSPAPLREKGRPSLLFTKSQVESIRSRAKSDEGRKVLAALSRLLQTGHHGNVSDGEPVACDGFAAAGHAMLHWVEANADRANKAADFAAKVIKSPPADWRIARELVGLAIAYDLCGESWPDDARASAGKFILTTARRIAALEQGPDIHRCVFGAGELLGNLDGPHDYRLASARAAAGIALLAILPDLTKADSADVGNMLQIVRRSIARFLQSGIGEHGAGTGNYGYAPAIEAVFPFLQAWRNVTAEDLAAGTGAQHAAAWAMFTRGLAFNRGPDFASAFWLPAAAGAADGKYGPMIAARWGSHVPANPLDAVLTLVNAPTGPVPPRNPMPLVLLDKRMGAFATRSGWDDARDFVTMFEMGSSAPQAANMRGQFSVYGLGREWIRRHHVPFGRFDWPATAHCNVLQVLKSEATRRGDAVFDGGGFLERIRADRNGTASMSMSTRGFSEPGAIRDDTDSSKSWRTLGVDYRPTASGSPGATIVMVEGAVGLADRQQVWEIDLGNVPKEAVKIDGLKFVVKPHDSKATLAGTFLYPTTVFIDYLPPAEGRPGRLRAFREKPGEKSLTALMKKLDDRLDGQIQAMLNGQDSNIDIRKFDLPLEEENTDLAARLQRQSEIVYLKLLKETSSIKMGGGDRRPRAKGNLVVVMTIQEGDAAPVRVLDTKSEALARVGDRTITYIENLIEFGQ